MVYPVVTEFRDELIWQCVLVRFCISIMNLCKNIKIGTCSGFPILGVYFPARADFYSLVMAGIMNNKTRP